MGFVPRLKVLLCAPVPTESIGGGYLYNSKIAAYPEIHAVFVQPDLLVSRICNELWPCEPKRTSIPTIHHAGVSKPPRYTHVLLDSLYLHHSRQLFHLFSTMRRLGFGNRVPPLGLLAHLLPSQNLSLVADGAATAHAFDYTDNARGMQTMHTIAEETMLIREFTFAIAPSRAAGELLVRRGMPACRIGIARPAPVFGATPRRTRALTAGDRELTADRSSDPKQSEIEFLSVANFTDRKNLSGLLPVLSSLLNYSWRWSVVSGDSESDFRRGKARFSTLLRSYGFQERVHIFNRPKARQLHELFDRAQVFILAPHAETYGIVFVEALRHGCAVIGPDAAPFTEYLEDGWNAVTAKPGNRKAWIAACENLLQNPNLVRRLQTNAARSAAGHRSFADTHHELCTFLHGFHRHSLYTSAPAL